MNTDDNLTFEEFLYKLPTQVLTYELKDEILDQFQIELDSLETFELIDMLAMTYENLVNKHKFEYLISKIDDYSLEQLKEKLG